MCRKACKHDVFRLLPAGPCGLGLPCTYNVAILQGIRMHGRVWCPCGDSSWCDVCVSETSRDCDWSDRGVVQMFPNGELRLQCNLRAAQRNNGIVASIAVQMGSLLLSPFITLGAHIIYCL